jgi:hypothetical protein
VISLYQAFPGLINNLWLVAPDGIQPSFWHKLATRPIIFQDLFRYLMEHPEHIFRLTSFLGSLRLMNSSLVRFTHNELQDSLHRKMVYQTWTTFRDLKIDVAKVFTYLDTYETRIRIYLGSKDKIIPPKKFKPLQKRHPNLSIDILDSGHGNLMNEVAFRYYQS